jgi:HEAT repeat protein
MFTRSIRNFMRLALTLSMLCAPLVVHADETTPPVTKATVLSLLPTGPDMLDEVQMTNYKKLLNMGEAAIPCLAEILSETNDCLAVRRILSIVAQCKGNRKAAVKPTKELVNRFSGNSRDATRIRADAAQTIGAIGGAEDASALYPLLEDADERVRINAVRSLAKIGNAESLAQIEANLDARKKNAHGELQNDAFLQESSKAAEAIKRRLTEEQKPSESR